MSIDFWSNRQIRSYWRHCSFHFKLKATQYICWLADDRNPQLEEIVSNFEITNKRIFSITGQMFKPDKCRLTDERFEALMFININKDFKH